MRLGIGSLGKEDSDIFCRENIVYLGYFFVSQIVPVTVNKDFCSRCVIINEAA